MDKVLIIIPAYNEEHSISRVITDLRLHFPAADILVVNDGSNDNTLKIARSFKGVLTIDLPVNLGIGGAVQTGFKYACKYDYDLAIQFDGDGQHKAEEIPKLTRLLTQGRVDMAIGSRFVEKSGGFRSTRMRRVGIHWLAWMNSLLIHAGVTDTTSGFRGYNKRTIAFLARHYPSDYPEPEAVILLGRNGFCIREIHAEMRERQGGHSSISGFKSAYYMIKVSLAILINLLRPKL